MLTLWGVVTVIFLLFNVMQGDPARMMLDQNEDPVQLAAIRHNLGYDQPKFKQYLYYLNDLSPISINSKDREDFTYYSKAKYGGKVLFSTQNYDVVLKYPYLRKSYQKQGKPVAEIIAETLPNTLILATSAIVIAFILGIVLGIISAVFKDTWIDKFFACNHFDWYECAVVFCRDHYGVYFCLSLGRLHASEHDGEFIRSR